MEESAADRAGPREWPQLSRQQCRRVERRLASLDRRPEVRMTPFAIHRLQVTLQDIDPPIRRVIEVPSDVTLRALHDVLQAAMGWQDYHLWLFEVGDVEYGQPDPDDWMDYGDPDVDLCMVAPRRGEELAYLYGFGDEGRHVIRVLSVIRAEDGVRYPRCIGGSGTCPPEDAGGSAAWMEMLEVLRDPEAEDREGWRS